MSNNAISFFDLWTFQCIQEIGAIYDYSQFSWKNSKFYSKIQNETLVYCHNYFGQLKWPCNYLTTEFLLIPLQALVALSLSQRSFSSLTSLVARPAVMAWPPSQKGGNQSASTGKICTYLVLVCKKLAVAPYSAPTSDFSSSCRATTLFGFPSLRMHPAAGEFLNLYLFEWHLIMLGFSLLWISRRHGKGPRLVKYATCKSTF